MPSSIVRRKDEVFPHDPGLRGFHIVYRRDEVNHCPGCGRTHWIIGRFSAECGFCATALPLADTAMLGAGTFGRGGGQAVRWSAAA
ncbi:MAG: hypothetical protein ACK4K7_06170 [Allosphingosinicella sp.]|uniref:hypothetical protein n=1 Tax=Allosphingosinicella sp. TaxID=2823234 RepID=UPI00392D8714